MAAGPIAIGQLAAGAVTGPVPSWNLIADIRQMLGYQFMVSALRAGTIAAVLAGTLGWYMVLRRQAFAGHTLSVVTFPGAAGAVLIGLPAVAGYYVAAIGAAVLIALIPRGPGGGAGVGAGGRESAVIGTVQAFALACGALFASLYGGFLNGATGLLFGTFLGISSGQVLILAVVAVVAMAALATIGRPLFFASIDPDVARARGLPVTRLSAIYLVLLGCAAAEVSQITGALLVFALLVMPAAAAQRLTARPGRGYALTIGFSVLIVWTGLGLAFYSVYPVGFYITSAGFACFVLSSVAGRLASR